MTVSERVKLCLTKIASLFTCSASQVDLPRGERLLSVERTPHLKISVLLLAFTSGLRHCSWYRSPSKSAEKQPQSLHQSPLDRWVLFLAGTSRHYLVSQTSTDMSARYWQLMLEASLGALLPNTDGALLQPLPPTRPSCFSWTPASGVYLPSSYRSF